MVTCITEVVIYTINVGILSAYSLFVFDRFCDKFVRGVRIPIVVYCQYYFSVISIDEADVGPFFQTFLIIGINIQREFALGHTANIRGTLLKGEGPVKATALNPLDGYR